METLYPQSIFTVAPTRMGLQPFDNRQRTLRLAVPANVEARALRVRLSNACSLVPLRVGAITAARCIPEGALVPTTLRPVTIGGLTGVDLAPGEECWTDDVELDLLPGQEFVLSLYYPGEEKVESGNWLGAGSTRTKAGNYTADIEIGPPRALSRVARTLMNTDMTIATTTVAEVVALCEKPGRVLACFGDSITQQANWTEPLTKLLFHKYPGEISVCNLGISGNRLLYDSPPNTNGLLGEAGISRLERDALGLSGLTYAVVALGSNDLGHPGAAGGAPLDEVPTTAQYATGMMSLASRLHALGTLVYAATMTPRPLVKPYDEAREALRHEMNDWIRSAPCFDAVLDFDAVLRRPDGAPGIRDGCVLPDGLHPNVYGGLLLAKSIPLSLFGGE